MAGNGMRDRYVPFQILCPAGTTPAAPLSTNPNTGQAILVAVHVLIPAGHAGLTGIRVDLASQTILPWAQPSTWIVADDLDKEFLVGEEVGATLRIVTYNTDTYPHTFYGFLHINDLPDPMTPAVQLLPVGQG